jgi:Chaperone of endosialidase
MTTIHKNFNHLPPLQLGLPRVQPIWLIRGFLLIPLGLACFALAPIARAVTPAPDGAYGSNTAEGQDALFSLTTGFDNTAIGFDALYRNTDGFENTATGRNALYNNTGGGDNTATGAYALRNNTGSVNTADGSYALSQNSTGQSNTAVGNSALTSNTKGNNNTATGQQALLNNTTGNSNTANGYHALLNNTGNNNIAIGRGAGSNLTNGDNNIDIAALGTAGDSNTIRIGKSGVQTRAFIQGISGSAVTGTTVVVTSTGQLGMIVSSARFKDEIKPMDKASEAILALKPVTFRYKKDLDPEGIPQFGLVAEEVEKVNPDLVARDADGKAHTVRYEAVNAMLLNEFLKEHRTVQELKKEIAALTATVQKVTAQVEMSRPAPQTVVNNH